MPDETECPHFAAGVAAVRVVLRESECVPEYSVHYAVAGTVSLIPGGIHRIAEEPGVFLRYGDPPPGGRSRNYRTGRLEAGLSVYPSVLVDGERAPLLVRNEPQDYSCGMLDRPVLVLVGIVLGTGSDGEPVIEVGRVLQRGPPVVWRLVRIGVHKP